MYIYVVDCLFICVYRLMDYIGPEGDEARALLREIRSLAINAATTHNTQAKSRYLTTTTSTTASRSATTQSLRSPPPQQQQQQQSPRPTDRSSFGGYVDMSSSALSPSPSPAPNYNDMNITSSASMTYMSPYSRILRSHPTTGRPSTGTGRLSTGTEAAGAGGGGGVYSLYQSMQADDGEGDLEEELMLSPSASMYVTKIIMYCMHNLVYSALYIVYILVGYTAVQVIHRLDITATVAAVINACLSLI